MSSTSSTRTVCYYPDLETLFSCLCVCIVVSAHMACRWKESHKCAEEVSFKQSRAVQVVVFGFDLARHASQNHMCLWLCVTAQSWILYKNKVNTSCDSAVVMD